jgi:sec-independent protein translocase protein TatA
MPGGGELIIIVVVVLLLFGGKKIPELMRGLGRGIREFNDAKSSVTQELEEGLKDTPRTNKTPVNTTTGSSTNPNVTNQSTNPNVTSSSNNSVTTHD